MSASSPKLGPRKPLFEASDILDFDFPQLPTPPRTHEDGTGSLLSAKWDDEEADEPMDLDAELAMMEAEMDEITASRKPPHTRTSPRSGSPESLAIASCMSSSPL
jgi:hypothetical protein